MNVGLGEHRLQTRVELDPGPGKVLVGGVPPDLFHEVPGEQGPAVDRFAGMVVSRHDLEDFFESLLDKIIDLNVPAFKKLGNLGQGVVNVKVEEILD